MQERRKADNAANTPPVRHSFCFIVRTRSDRPMKDTICVDKAPNPCWENGVSCPVRRILTAIMAEWTARSVAIAMNVYFIVLGVLCSSMGSSVWH